MSKTKIEWCDKAWNPVTGCTKIATGCANCYAEVNARRFWGDRTFSDVQCHEDRLDQPTRWRKPSRIFVNSMSDLFHEKVPISFIDRVFAVMALCPQHTFIVLTKRGRRMDNYVEQMELTETWPNVWLGVSASTQSDLSIQAPHLLRCPAAVRVISLEPLLEPVSIPILGIGWMIVGCESGPKRRPFDADWARTIRDKCAAGGVPFFLKQTSINGQVSHDPSEWPTDLQDCRQWPDTADGGINCLKLVKELKNGKSPNRL